jgi:hypothetical protein
MKLIKKSEKLIQETKITEEIQQPNFQNDTINIQEPMVEEQPEGGLGNKKPNYILARDNLIVLSVGKTGWQVSDIWKDIRLDKF